MDSRFKRIVNAVVGKSCPICLNRLHHRKAAVIIPCMHAYCIDCIRRWSHVKRKCPLCNADFDSCFSRISFSSVTYKKEQLSGCNVTKKLHLGFASSRQRDRLVDQRVIRRRREELNAFGSRTRPFPRRRSFDQIGASNLYDINRRIVHWRASIYEQRLQAVPFSSKNCRMQHIDNRSAKEKMVQRIEPWVRRELQAILGDPDPSIIVHVVTSLFISEYTHSMQQRAGDDVLAPLRPFLHERAEMFWHELSENEQVEPPVLTQLPEDDILNRDLADAQSEEENSDYDNNADESGDNTPFPREDGDEEDENEGPDLTREYAPPPVRPRAYESQVSFRSRKIPYLYNLPSMPDVDALTRDFDENSDSNVG